MIMLDTYDLGNGNVAQLIESDLELSCGVSVEPKYAIDIMNGVRTMSAIPFQPNPFDAIFILMDLGLVKADIDWCEPRVISYRENSIRNRCHIWTGNSFKYYTTIPTITTISKKIKVVSSITRFK